MTGRRLIDIRIRREDAEKWMADPAFRNAIPMKLGAMLSKALKNEQSTFDAAEAQAKWDAERAAKRAESHTLTRVQAEAMCAAKFGKSPSRYRPEKYGDRYHWKFVRSMGGATFRMISRLIEEGMIKPDRMNLTEAGRARLDAWEAKHGVLYVQD